MEKKKTAAKTQSESCNQHFACLKTSTFIKSSAHVLVGEFHTYLHILWHEQTLQTG